HGDIHGWFKALDAKTGQTLWRFMAGSGISAAPITYTVDGKQYVAVVSGRTFAIPPFFGKRGEQMVAASPDGGALFVFELWTPYPECGGGAGVAGSRLVARHDPGSVSIAARRRGARRLRCRGGLAERYAAALRRPR